MNKVILRKFSEKDMPIFKKWLYLPHVANWYNEPLEWINEIENRKSEFSFIQHFIVEKDKTPIGFCQFYEYQKGGEKWHGNTDINGTYSIDYFIGEPAYLGKGFGKAIVQVLIEKIKTITSAKRIIVKPETENKASCNTLLSCGFSFDKSNQFYFIKL